MAECAARKAASVAKHAAASSTTSTATSNAPQYVDRAAARREALGQPDHPVHQKKRKFEGPAPPAQKVEQPNRANVEIEESNVGSKMLEKMVSFHCFPLERTSPRRGVGGVEVEIEDLS